MRIGCVDDEPTNPLELIATGSLPGAVVSRVTVFHDADHPSYLLLPITKGNVMNTYFSGGSFLAFEAHPPKRALKIGLLRTRERTKLYLQPYQTGS